MSFEVAFFPLELTDFLGPDILDRNEDDWAEACAVRRTCGAEALLGKFIL